MKWKWEKGTNINCIQITFYLLIATYFKRNLYNDYCQPELKRCNKPKIIWTLVVHWSVWNDLSRFWSCQVICHSNDIMSFSCEKFSCNQGEKKCFKIYVWKSKSKHVHGEILGNCYTFVTSHTTKILDTVAIIFFYRCL